ncbi:hypothetical protein G5V57_17745 [Nordella sp. HKS 07]|uniref:hypothetical protein n=1 Tax=Nordella sp. HKS 07 TaxID=2712222 RepID=UPI0013E1CD25|nr:hypothetical protein [Nordella sp. HKS 07]QIG49398.1 hypothetical protein G5V57_17745 [Nordella sp. HKS 07]
MAVAGHFLLGEIHRDLFFLDEAVGGDAKRDDEDAAQNEQLCAGIEITKHRSLDCPGNRKGCQLAG